MTIRQATDKAKMRVKPTVQANHGIDFMLLKRVFNSYDDNGEPCRCRTFSSMDTELSQLYKLHYRESIIIANRRVIHGMES